MVLAGIGGLGSACTTTGPMTPKQIYATAINAGFPPNVATQMVAIALRESAGCPDGRYTGSTARPNSENSFGLWQINVQANPGIMAQLGITDPNQLLDPETNARAAYLLYGGNPANLDVAWYINRPGYQEAYQKLLPVAEAAATEYAGGDPGGVWNEEPPVDEAASGSGISTGTVLAILGVGLLGLVLVKR